MNPIFFQLLRTILEVGNSQSARLTALEKEESRESAEEAAALQQAQALLEQLTMGGVVGTPPGFVPSDI